MEDSVSRPIVRFQMPGKLRLGEQDGFRLHGHEQRRLVCLMRRILVQSCRPELTNALGRFFSFLKDMWRSG